MCLPLSAFAGLSSPNLIISWHRYPLPRSAQRWSISRSEVRPLGRCGASFGQERADRLPTCLWPLLPSPRRRARVLPTPRRLPSTPVHAARLRRDHQRKLPGAPGLAFALNGLSSLWRVFTGKQSRATARLREIGADDGPTRQTFGSEAYLYIRLQKGEISNRLFSLRKRGGETK